MKNTCLNITIFSFANLMVSLSGTLSGFTKGVASGVGGLVVAPFVGALVFIAKTSDGIGATTRMLNLGVIEARCRPAR